MMRSLLSVSGGTLVSRVLGLIREMAIAWTFGANAATDAFWVAFRIVRTGDEALIVESRQTLAVIQMPQGKPARLPADWATRFAHLRGKS